MERVSVGVDGSAASLKAVDFAADLAAKYDCRANPLGSRPTTFAGSRVCGRGIRTGGTGSRDQTRPCDGR